MRQVDHGKNLVEASGGDPFSDPEHVFFKDSDNQNKRLTSDTKQECSPSDLSETSVTITSAMREALYKEMLSQDNAHDGFAAFKQAAKKEFYGLVDRTKILLAYDIAKCKARFNSTLSDAARLLAELVDIGVKVEGPSGSEYGLRAILSYKAQAEANRNSICTLSNMLRRSCQLPKDVLPIQKDSFPPSYVLALEAVTNEYDQHLKGVFQAREREAFAKIDNFIDLFAFLRDKGEIKGSRTWPAEELIDRIREFRTSGDFQFLNYITDGGIGLRAKVASLYNTDSLDDTVRIHLSSPDSE